MYLFSGGDFSELTPIGSSTKCSLSIAVNTIGLCRRGGVERSRAGRKSWSISAGGFLAENGDILPFPKYVGQPLSIAISVLQEDLLRLGVDLPSIEFDSEVTLVGCVIVNSAKLSGAKGSFATRDVSFTGDGELGLLVDRDGFPYILPIEL